jgi:DNA-binding transcriptional MerR regulator
MNGRAAMIDEGITYRQLDYWTRRGYLHALNAGHGAGSVRQWSAFERLIASWIGRLTAAGLTLDAAARVARTARNGTCELAPGIRITLDAS